MWHLLCMLFASPKKVEITGLYRHPVKGMNADSLQEVIVSQRGETFPDDRRYALLWNKNIEKWKEEDPEWLHKENFLCAFTAPKLFAEYLTSYQIVGSVDSLQSYGSPCDQVCQDMDRKTKRLLTLRNRATDEILLDSIDLSTNGGREQLATFFCHRSGKDVVCVTGSSDNHKHQFGNTSSGVKARGDTRTIHIINAATVRELSTTLQIPINPTRFRPNIVLDGLEPWEEFKWVDKSIRCGDMKLGVIKQTVRCAGVSVDPLDQDNVLDIPKQLTKHYPMYGPYFGVYAVIDEPGTVKIGDTVSVTE